MLFLLRLFALRLRRLESIRCCLQLMLLYLNGVVCFQALAAPLQAQPSPDQLPAPILPEPPPPLPANPLPPPAELLPPLTAPVLPETPSGVGPEMITVQQFNVVGSTVFSPQLLEAVTAPFTGRPITFAELLQARSAVTQLYVDNGYVTSGALIPPQTFTDGVIQIQVVEGGLETINVTGTERLKPSYVRHRLAIAASPPLNTRQLLEALQLLQLDPLIETISAELSASSQVGQSILEVQVTEADSFEVPLVLDNNRSPSVGSFQRQFQIEEANLTGVGDSLTGAFSNTDGSNQLEVSYTRPVNPRNGALSVGFYRTASRVIEPPFDTLDIKGSSWEVNLSFRQPVLQRPSQEVALGLTVARRESETSLMGMPFPLSAGADIAGQTQVTGLRFFQDWTQRETRNVFAARSQFTLGFGDFSVASGLPVPDDPFFVWRGQAQYVRLLAPDTLLLLRSDLQLTPSVLVPQEQFGLGGQPSVRGYRQDALLSDNGLLASAEFRLPVYRAPRRGLLLQLAPFVEFGTAWSNAEQSDLGPNTLASIGLGLRFQWSERFFTHLDWGIPLISIDADKRTLQENGFYFSVVYNPF